MEATQVSINNDPYKNIEGCPLTISEEPEKHVPVDKLAIIGVVTAVVFAALVAVSFLFAPLAFAIPFTIVGALAILGGFAYGVATQMILPSTIHLYVAAATKPAGIPWCDSDYDVNAKLKTKDGTTLHGNFTSRYGNKSNKNTPLSERKITIIFHGNAAVGTSGNLHNHVDGLSHDFDSDYLEMNYRGYGTGIMPRRSQLVKDGVEIVKGLEAKGYKRKNITIFAHSIGGSIGPQVKQTLDKEKTPEKVYLIAYHTMFNMGKVVSNFIKAFAPGLACIGPGVAKSVGWDYKFTAKEWKKFGNDAEAFGAHNDDMMGNHCLAKMLQKQKIKLAFLRRIGHCQIDIKRENERKA